MLPLGLLPPASSTPPHLRLNQTERREDVETASKSKSTQNKGIIATKGGTGPDARDTTSQNRPSHCILIGERDKLAGGVPAPLLARLTSEQRGHREF